MNSPLPLLSIIFAIGMTIGGTVLAMLPPAPERSRPLMTSVRVAELAPPCKRAAGSNIAERDCDARAPQVRDSAKRDPAIVASARVPRERVAAAPELASQPVEPTPPATPTPPSRPTTVALAVPTPVLPHLRVAAAFAQLPPTVEAIAMAPTPVETSPNPAGAETARAAPRVKSEAARPMRNVASHAGPIPVTSVAANGARRTIVIRPTSQQDVYYYAARRQFAAANSVRPQ